jgi:KDO2-lipid IV(A) lauroyltransferase
MSAIIYYLTLPFLYLISYLPFKLLYLVSDLFYVLIYKVFAYRKKVVTENLKNSFPEKTTAEINQIRDGFYHYFCDLILETIKNLSISPAALKKHFSNDDLSAFERYYKEKQSVIVVLGHLGNWELCGSYFCQLPIHQMYIIYHPLKNQHFDKLFNRMRTRLGGKIYPMKSAFRGMLKNRNEVTATAFVADQTPAPRSAHWMPFLNQDTAVFKGVEVISRKLDYPVIYISVIREKRGQYRLHSELLVEHPKELSENELTELHSRRLQQDIISYPETWLWSHRRWKHKRPEKDHEKKR